MAAHWGSLLDGARRSISRQIVHYARLTRAILDLRAADQGASCCSRYAAPPIPVPRWRRRAGARARAGYRFASQPVYTKPVDHVLQLVHSDR